MHLHLGIIHALTIFASVIVIGFFWRVCAMALSQSDNATLQDIGQGMVFIY